MNAMPPAIEMERAYLRGDAAYDGLFIVAVRTTGIYCRPTCPARKPLPRNVAYYPDAESARAAGYRACKRCRPDAPDDRPDWASRLIAEIDADPTARLSEKDLRARGFDPATVRRYFQKAFGLTFQEYIRGRRLALAHGRLREGRSLDDTAAGVGFESLGGFRDAFVRTFGVPPGRVRANGSDCLVLSWFPSPVGPLLAGAASDGVRLLAFTREGSSDAELREVSRRGGLPVVPGMNDHLERLRDELDAYFAGRLRAFETPLVQSGTPFQTRVWDELRRIPYGETISYEELAVRVGNPGACRAVGTANGANRIVIAVPCHRVVNKGGRLGGYGGGLRRKEFLLNLEKAHAGAEPAPG